MWNIRGWNRLTVHDDPPLVAARQEFQSWLTEVPEPWQSKWRGKLESALDHPHLSVRLELYLHHYFKSEGWAVDIEPEMHGILNKPDFRVMRGTDTILVEAKAILDKQTITQETRRLRQVADNLSGKLSRDVIIEPLSDLPPSLPARKIKAQIEQHAKNQAGEILEFDLSDVHQSMQYSVKVVLLPKTPDTTEPGGVGVTISGVHTPTIGKRIRDAVKEKTGKYGSIDMPFVIAVYGRESSRFRPRTNLMPSSVTGFGTCTQAVRSPKGESPTGSLPLCGKGNVIMNTYQQCFFIGSSGFRIPTFRWRTSTTTPLP